MKCKCLVEASQVVLLFNNRCGALHFPLLESVQIEEGPCQNLLRGSEEKYSQSPAHKGDMKKGEKEGGGDGRRVRNQEWFNTKVHVGAYHQKEGSVCVSAHTLERIDSHGCLRFAASEDSTESVPASFNQFLCLSHFLSFFIRLRTILQSLLCTVRPDEYKHATRKRNVSSYRNSWIC